MVYNGENSTRLNCGQADEKLSATLMILEQLRSKIINGQLRPGKSLREVEIANVFHVSRTPIREAFRILQSEGLVTYVPNRGVVVSEGLNEREIYELTLVWGILCTEASYQAAKNITEEGREKLFALQQEMESMPFDPVELYYMDHKLHETIALLSGNMVLHDYIVNAQAKMKAIIYATKFREERYRESFKEHQKIILAIAEGEEEPAKYYTNIHFINSAQSHKINIQKFNERLG